MIAYWKEDERNDLFMQIHLKPLEELEKVNMSEFQIVRMRPEFPSEFIAIHFLWKGRFSLEMRSLSTPLSLVSCKQTMTGLHFEIIFRSNYILGEEFNPLQFQVRIEIMGEWVSIPEGKDESPSGGDIKA